MVKDMRIKSIQRNRSNDQRVQLKLKGEAKSREAEAAFVESLQKNAFFDQVILEREGERQGSGIDFDYTLSVASNPPPYLPLPKAPAPARTAAGKLPAALPRAAAVPPPAPARPVPVPAAAPENPPQRTEPAPVGPARRFPGRINPFTPGQLPSRRHPVSTEGDQ